MKRYQYYYVAGEKYPCQVVVTTKLFGFTLRERTYVGYNTMTYGEWFDWFTLPSYEKVPALSDLEKKLTAVRRKAIADGDSPR